MTTTEPTDAELRIAFEKDMMDNGWFPARVDAEMGILEWGEYDYFNIIDDADAFKHWRKHGAMWEAIPF